MKKIILFITLGFTTMLLANTFDTKNIDRKHPQVKKHLQKKVAPKHLNTKQKRHMKKMDKQLSHRKAMKRKFKSHDDFKKMKRRHTKRVHRKGDNRRSAKHFSRSKHSKNVKALKRSSQYSNHSNYNNDRYNDRYDNYDRYNYRDDYRRNQSHIARGYRHTKNSWYLAYRYERASFYDRHGYYYGHFNRHGYLFEGEYYRYDRYYTYRDRLKGKGLFERRYYRPIMNNYYAHNDFYGNIGGLEFFFRR